MVCQKLADRVGRERDQTLGERGRTDCLFGLPMSYHQNEAQQE
jgi:hypothetical protein